ADHMLMVTNDDRPGVIGTVGTLLGAAGVNIADMDVGRADEAGTAVMLIAPTSPVDPVTVDALRAAPGILSVAALQA
ncbi:MAG: ACT domain-containing protein, partial [Ilumatobacteraceae bacterium]